MPGNSSQQGRIFSFFETGRGVVDTVVTFSALAVFAWFGSGYLSFKMEILFYSGVAILVGGIIFLFLKDDKHAVTEPVNVPGENKEKKPGVSAVLKDGTVWLIALVTFIFLPHESMPVYLGMVCTPGFGTIVFTQRDFLHTDW